MLLMRPLYHITEYSERIAAIKESKRLMQPPGIASALIVNLLFKALFVKGRIECIKVFGVKFVCENSQVFTKSLIMHNLAFTQKTDRVYYIRIVTESEDVVVGYPCFLLCCNYISATYQKFQCISTGTSLVFGILFPT